MHLKTSRLNTLTLDTLTLDLRENNIGPDGAQALAGLRQARYQNAQQLWGEGRGQMPCLAFHSVPLLALVSSDVSWHP